MKNSTIRLIYALKNNHKTYDVTVSEYLSDKTGISVEYFNDEVLAKIAQDAFLDYISTADNPRYEVWNLFNNMWLFNDNRSFDKRAGNAIWATLALTDVRDRNGFVNGFRELND